MRGKVSSVLVGLLLTMLIAAPSLVDAVEITEDMIKEATPADEGTILIEIAKEEEVARRWEKYFYFDVDQNLNEDSQSLWTRFGMRKGSFDISFGWTQRFNDPGPLLMDKGIASLSMSYWW